MSVSIGGKEDGTDGTFGTRVLARFAPSNGNYAAGGLNVLQAILGVIGFRGSCFAAGTPLLTPTGEKSVEEFRPGDWIPPAQTNLSGVMPAEIRLSRVSVRRLHGGRGIRTVRFATWKCIRRNGNALNAAAASRKRISSF
ncbi:MAG TPA: hypothetical protein VGY66_04785 [Gemmataceae bacterium]|nr:hypothetical protein [Gemmataceae bacterium]